MYDPSPSDEARERIDRAAAACPVKALTVEPPGAGGASGARGA
jgi:ferredoxin